ncbi:S1C family serine protease [Sulfuriroseicoccus oceanibius]|uniref:Trypsin-like peptidase domain-containing protein n=1 Tax=Sulfuriroseicoccus oceanibius TaxID=2707525 RepID=A0A6B3L8Z5_9BACT|nr:S1C family serine protease [Sulfuriroseicoccus oceanibius]QQL43688.1 trypsin-like peptidase domain-containing protein [Sulfuriroseicoccus oceanibius]
MTKAFSFRISSSLRRAVTLVTAALGTSLASHAAETTPATESTPTAAYQSVIRIQNSSQIADYRTPWNPGNYSGGTGSGFLVGENRFLTNAHVVSNTRRLLVTKHGSPRELPARIVAIAHDCDLALLEIIDDEDYQNAFEGVPQLEIGEVPRLESEVRVIGYPVGGERISVTRGVVSRIDFRPYSHSQVDQHLVIQIDAAINPGNSGGPVLQANKVVGVAFQGLTSADNTGYMIPTPVIKRFLTDVGDGSYDHYVDLAIDEFPLMNPAQRKALGLPDNDRGILVVSVLKGGTCDGKLESGDILMAIDDHPIFSDGKVNLNGESVTMHEIVERKFAGDLVKLEVLRNGEAEEVTVSLKPFDPSRIFQIRYGERPRFVTAAGFVFQPLNRNVMAAHPISDLEGRKLIADYIGEGLYTDWEEIVVLTQILPDSINADVTGFRRMVVDKINGVKIRKLQDVFDHLYQPMAQGKLPEFTTIHCLGAERPIVIESEKMIEAHARIRSKYGVSSDHFLDYENYELEHQNEETSPAIEPLDEAA